MNKIIYYVAQSLDGFIARHDGRVDWLAPFETVDYGYNDFIAKIGTLVLGSHTYEQCLSFGGWPYGARPTFVATGRSLPRPTAPEGGESPDVRFVAGTVATIAAAARQAADPRDVWLVGGGQLAGSFFAAGLVDELHLFLIPVLLGSGKSLTAGQQAEPPWDFELRESRRWANGVVGLQYTRPAAR